MNSGIILVGGLL